MRIKSEKNLKKAYSLIELSIVIVIISILITGALSVSISSINNAKIKTTNDRIKEIYQALGNYLLANGRLPCPADSTLPKGNSTYGTAIGAAGTCSGSGVWASQAAGATNLVYGMVPVLSLNLSNEMAEDGFESKFAYIVDKRATLASPLSGALTSTFSAGFVAGTPDPNGEIAIISQPSGATIATADFAIVSFGANKSGAYGANSSSQTTRSTDAHEMDNDVNPFAVGGAGDPYFNGNLVSVSSSSDKFDDIVFFKKRTAIMVEFKALSAVTCPTYGETLYGGTTTTWGSGGTNGTYDQAVMGTACPVGFQNSSANPYRRCGAFGQWGALLTPCT